MSKIAKSLRKNINHNSLIFKNGLKDAWKAKAQLLGLIILVFLSATIFTILEITQNRVIGNYESLISESVEHDFIADFSDTNILKMTAGPQKYSDDELAQLVLNSANTNSESGFVYSRVEGRTFSIDGKLLKVLTTDNQQPVDKLVISNGTGLKQNDLHGIVLNQQFANNCHLAIGDIIRLQSDQYGGHIKVSDDVDLKAYNNQDINDWLPNSIYNAMGWLQVRGYGMSADFTTSILDQTTPLPNKKAQGIGYLNYQNFGLVKHADLHYYSYNRDSDKFTVASDADKEIYYPGKFMVRSDINQQLVKLNQYVKDNSLASFNNKYNTRASVVFGLRDKNYRFYNRTNLLSNISMAFNLLGWLLIALILVISLFAMALVIRKRIENARTQLGLLKSLGYSNAKLSFSFFAYPVLIALIGGTVGWLIGLGLQSPVIGVFAQYFNLNFGSFVFDWLSWTYSILIIFAFLAFLTWILSYLMLHQNTIELIKNQGTIKMPQYGAHLKKLFAKTPFNTRLKISMFASSTGKMTAVGLTMLLGTIMLTAAVLGPKIMNDNLSASYTGLDYKTSVEYQAPIWNLPYTFYKTYNPTVKPWTPTTVDNKTYFQQPIDKVIAELNSGDISSSYYNYDINYLKANNFQPLAFLNWKTIDTNFLRNQGKYGGDQPTFMTDIICQQSWPKYAALLAEPTLKPLFAQLSSGTNNVSLSGIEHKPLQNAYNMLRNFYLDFRSTVNMSVNPDYLVGTQDNYQPNIAADHLMYDNLHLIRVHDGDSTAPRIAIYDHHLPKELDLQIVNNHPMSSLANTVASLINWFVLTFYQRTGDCIVQGTYSRAPYFVREYMASAFAHPEQNYNISFGVVPFNLQTDFLGTYLNAQLHGDNFKIYGLSPQQNFVQLADMEGNDLAPRLFAQHTSCQPEVVINESLAKKYNIQTGDQMPASILQQSVAGSFNNHDWNDTAWNFDNITNLQNPNNYGPFGVDYTSARVGSSNPYGSLFGLTPTAMEKAAANHQTYISNDYEPLTFRVVGVANSYGAPRAYIANNIAQHLLHYDQTANYLYKMFYQEWANFDLTHWSINPPTGDIPLANDFLRAIKKYDSLAALQRDSTSDKVAAYILQTFNHEYPIFNYKLSKNDGLDDMQSGFTTAQMYGDYSMYGLDGGSDSSGTVYPAYSMGGIAMMLPTTEAKALLYQITALIDTILITFAVIAFIIAFTIIMLSTNLIIRENRTIISCMKALGYSNPSIAYLILGMYIPLIVISYLLGVVISWFIINGIINHLAMTTVWVLPVIFAWWIPFVVLGVVICIYLITFIFSWFDLQRVGLIYALKVAE